MSFEALMNEVNFVHYKKVIEEIADSKGAVQT